MVGASDWYSEHWNKQAPGIQQAERTKKENIVCIQEMMALSTIAAGLCRSPDSSRVSVARTHNTNTVQSCARATALVGKTAGFFRFSLSCLCLTTSESRGRIIRY